MSNPPLNIVLLMADQWRWNTIFQPEHMCRTPNLNQFTESGIAFDSAFTNVPLCCPAHGSLLTRLWPHKSGLMDNVQPGSFYPNGQLRPDHKTYLERLRDGLGYAAHYAEKWHVGLGTAAERCIEAEVDFWGGNYDQNITWPAFFKDEITAWLKKVSDRLHSAGKILLTHTDGENRALLPLYPACGFDVAESVCPTPMTQCTLTEIKAGMGPEVTIWGGIPSVILLDSATTVQAFEEYLDKLFDTPGIETGMILGVSDNVPPDANFTRLEEIKKRKGWRRLIWDNTRRETT